LPRLSETHFAARRNRILEATFRCLARKGYSRLTMRDIAAEAGISVGTLYLYFKDKDEMVRALSETAKAETDAGVAGQLPAGGPMEVLGSILQALLRGLDDPERAESFRVDVQLWAEALHHARLRTLLLANQAGRIEQLSALVTEARKRGELPAEVGSGELARVVLAILVGLELQKVMDPRVPCEALAPTLRALLGQMSSPSSR